MISITEIGRAAVQILCPAILALVATDAWAVPIVVHEGSNDPTSEGWTLNTTGTGSTSAGTEVTGTGTHDFWNVQDTDTTGNTFYTQGLSAADVAGDWSLEASLRVIDAPVVAGTSDVPGMGIIVADGMNYWSFYIGNDRAGPVGNSGPLSLADTFFLDTISDYNLFEILFSQNGAGAADDTADFFINGSLVFDDVGRSGLFNSTEMLVYMGPVSTLGTANANWELVRLDDGSIAVPEPGTLALFGIGLAAIGLARRRRKV